MRAIDGCLEDYWGGTAEALAVVMRTAYLVVDQAFKISNDTHQKGSSRSSNDGEEGRSRPDLSIAML